MIPLFDPLAERAEIGDEIDAAVLRVLRSGRYIGGEEVERFEEELGAYLGQPVATCGSGTDAIRLALLAQGIGPGDEVVVPANTFSATAMAVRQTDATVVVCDVDPDLWVMTLESIRPARAGALARTILPVHLYGQPVPDLVSFWSHVTDGAQALGGRRGNGEPIGSSGTVAFSFYPTKGLGAFGDGGAVAGPREVVETVRELRDLGRRKGEHVRQGWNSRLDAAQAAVLMVKLPQLDDWTRRRRRLARRYRWLMDGMPLALPLDTPGHAWHLFVVRVSDRDGVRERMRLRGVETGAHYPVPIHLQSAHELAVLMPAPVPVAERLAGEVLSLPLWPSMTDEQQDEVVLALRESLR